jgi:hypothetical protein
VPGSVIRYFWSSSSFRLNFAALNGNYKCTRLNKKVLETVTHLNNLLVYSRVLIFCSCLVFQSVPPAVLVRFLREHRSEWADYNFDAYSASALKTSPCSLPGLRSMRFSGSQIIMPLAHTVENEEVCSVPYFPLRKNVYCVLLLIVQCTHYWKHLRFSVLYC